MFEEICTLHLLELKNLKTEEPDIIVGDNSILLNNFHFNYSKIADTICSDNKYYVK